MNKIKIQDLFILISTVFFLIQCKTDYVSYEEPVFAQKINAKIKIINDEYIFRYAHQPLLFDSLLIIGDMCDNDNICIFNRYNGNLIKSFGKIGNGPEELITPVVYSVDKINGYLYINDYDRKKIMQYNLRDIKKNERVKSNSFNLSEEVGNRNKIMFIKDSIFITDGFNDRMALVTPTRVINKLTNTPNIKNKFETEKDWFAYMQAYSCMAASPNGKKFVSATMIGGIIEIYNIEEENINLHYTAYLYEPIFDKKDYVFQPNNETIYGFCHLSATNNFFYATAHAKVSPSSMPNAIWKFDWDGNPIACYTCDYCIENFTVDEKDELIYATIYNKDGEQVLGILDLKNL